MAQTILIKRSLTWLQINIKSWEPAAPQTHHTTRQTARETGIHRSSVVRIIRDELRLTCVKKRHAQELTEANCFESREETVE